MIKIRIVLYATLTAATLFTCIGCETSIGTNYTTRWFYTAPNDPYKSRASGPTSAHGFTAYNAPEDK